ncbi:MAG: DNA mismatch repair endonuclease MutL [Myxococcota bacterium]
MIAVLDDHVIDQIAAGEVIERPASAVKELVENAFDAGAEAVQVELEEGGLERITISDDGRGMTRDDSQRCILRHATSKLRTVEDLAAIHSYGFRGEALSSIAAVSELVISTRRPEDAVGTRVEVAGGELLSVNDYGGPSGTTVDIRGLFYNTPARRKFMRSPATEQAHVVESALRVALGARRGGVVVGAGTRRLLDIPEDQSEVERVKAALGPRVRDLIPLVAYSADSVTVSGFIAPLDTLRNDTKGTWFFVNGRFVRERLLQRALVEVFRPQLPPGRYPMAVIYIDVDATSVDVNVHPQKLEVRFSDSSAVFRALTGALTELFTSGAFSQREAFSAPPSNGVERATERFMARAEDAPRPAYRTQGPVESRHGDYRPVPLQPELPSRPAASVDTRRWALRERENTVVLVDLVAIAQHRVEARLRDELAAGESATAKELLLPEVFPAEGELAQAIDSLGEALQRIGLEIGPAGPERYALRTVPEALGEAKPAEVLECLLPMLKKLRSPLEGSQLAALLRALASTAPVPSDASQVDRAVRAGGVGVFELTDEALRDLLAR